MDCICFDVSNNDFEQSQVIVRDSQGMRSRSTGLPNQLRLLLVGHIKKVKINQPEPSNGIYSLVFEMRLDRISPLQCCSISLDRQDLEHLSAAVLYRLDGIPAIRYRGINTTVDRKLD